MPGRRPLTYKVQSLAVEGGLRPHAIAICVRCQKFGTLPISRDNHNPEAIGKLFVRAGWKFDPKAAGTNTCPDCLRTIEARRNAYEGGGEVVSIKDGKPAGGPALVAAIAAKVEAVSPAARKRVRDLLDGTFDEEKGFYLDGYSDARVAGEVNIAEVVVREIREKAFGPIKSSPEMEAVRSLLSGLEARANSMAEQVNQIAGDLADARKGLELTRGELDEARRQLTAAEQRLGIKVAA